MTSKTATKEAPKSAEERVAELEAKLAAAEAKAAELETKLSAKGPGRASTWVALAASAMAPADSTLGKIQRAERDSQVEAIAKVARKLDAANLADVALDLAKRFKPEDKTEDEFVTALLTKSTRNRAAKGAEGTETKKVADNT